MKVTKKAAALVTAGVMGLAGITTFSAFGPDDPVLVCAPWPSTPDAACTGYEHTGVTLTDCPTTIDDAGTYDSCRFDGTLTVRTSGVTITRSLVDGGHVESSFPSIYDLKGLVLEDVQIIGPGDDGNAAVGNSNYTCRRCDVSGNNRGFAVANNVLIEDSYAHDFWIQPPEDQGPDSAHQTAISTHGGTGVRIMHNTLSCNSDAFACSSGFSFYSEDKPGINSIVVKHNRIHSDAGYGMLFGTFVPGKPYGITNVRVVDNIVSSDEFGAVGEWPGTQAGNRFIGNREPNGDLIVAE